MKYLIYLIIILAMFWLDLCSGSTGWINVSLTDLLGGGLQGMEEKVVMGLRLPAAITALSVGAALALAGLVMQVLFDNPLAGPGVMGVSSGAGLFASFALLAGVGQGLGLTFMAVMGSLAVLVLIILASLRLTSNTSLLILGLMIGYMASSMVSVLQYSAEAERLQRFVYWTLGSYQAVSWSGLKTLIPVLLLMVVSTILLRSQLDQLLLGDQHMANLGIKSTRVRLPLLVIVGVIVGSVTAYCGPLAFIGLAAPHVARMITPSDVHSRMIPHTLAIGAVIGLLSLYFVNAAWIKLQLPLNAVLSIFGAPVVIWLLLRKSHLSDPV